MISINKVKGRSMEPDLHNGDYIVVLTVFLNRLRLGDRVVINHPQFGRIVKEICDVGVDGYRVRGLNQHSTDSRSLGLITQDMIAGKVLYHISS